MFSDRVAAAATAFSCALLAATGAAVAPAAAAAARQPQGSARVVVAPRQGELVSGDVVRIAVRARMGANALRASLNGHPVARQFGPDRHGVRSLDASVSDGLRRGSNVLAVTVRSRSSRVRHATVRFRDRANAPMTGAGLARRVVVGKPVVLAGQITAGADANPASIRWTVVQHPPAAAGPSLELVHPTDRAARFTPHAAGVYVLKVSQGSGVGAVSDVVKLNAVPASPLVPVDTIVGSPGQAGIRVGTTTYTAPTVSGSPVAILQVLVLNRLTLGFASNTSYTNTSVMNAALAKLDDSDLVIVSLQDPGGAHTQVLQGEPIAASLGPIGFPASDPALTRSISGGDLSVIGVPGMSPGDADTHVDLSGGAMQGYLTPDQFLEYGFVSPVQLKVTVDAATPHCVSPGVCNGGYQVSELSALTGKVVDDKQFITNPANLDQGGAESAALNMQSYLGAVPSGDLVEIQTLSHSTPAGYTSAAPVSGGVWRGTMGDLAVAVAAVGGTRNGFNREALKGGPAGGEPVYSLIGWPGAGEGNGIEAAAGVGGLDDTPNLQVLLRLNRAYRMRPAQSRADGTVPDALQQLVLSAPGTGSWPLSGDTGATRALDYLGTLDPRLGCDPRSSYWTQSLTEADTDSLALTIDRAVFPGAQASDPCTGKPVDFDAAQFTAAQSELLTELKWVGNVRSYLVKISSPFATGALSGWTDAQTIADKIYQDASSPDGETALGWTQFVQTILSMLGPFTGGASTVIAGTLGFGTWLAGASTNGTPGEDEVRIKADQLGAELVAQAQQSQATLKRVGDIIVSDYAKLSTLGPVAGCAPGPTCNPAYSWTDEDRVAASTTFERGIERISYDKLMSLGYNVYRLNRYPDDRDTFDPSYGYPYNSGAQPPAVKRYDCRFVDFHPWYSTPTWPARATSDLLRILDPGDPSMDQWNVLVLAVPLGNDVYGTPPPDPLLNRMFDSVSGSNDPAAGGLGMSPSVFMSGAQQYGYENTGPGYDEDCTWDLP